MQKLLAFIDASIYSKSVCDHAGWIAQKTGAEVDLFHVIGRRETGESRQNLSGNITLGARSALLAELSALDEQRGRLAQKRGRAILEDGEALLRAAGAKTVTSRLRIGDIVETACDFEGEADMIMIGKRGEAADFAKLHLGSNLERIARAASKPLFVTSRGFQEPKTIMIAYDGGASSMKAVDYVARSPLFAGLTCHVVTVAADTAEPRRMLDDAKAMLAGGGYQVEIDVLQGPPEAAISEAVTQKSIDLLVMGAYGHSRIRSMIIGSTTSEVLRLCKIPVVLFR
ncbi:MAG: universal stress protein [Kiloniellales bacterium]